MDDKIMMFKKKLTKLKIDFKFHIKYQTPNPKKNIHKSKSW